MEAELNFGSDGIRGIIGHTFTRETVARVALGAAAYLRGNLPDQIKQPVLVGYDTRFMSREFAGYAAEILLAEGFKPRMADAPCPTPYVSFATRGLKAALALQFTASHNPPGYLGIKLKGSHGGSLYPKQAELVEFYAQHIKPEQVAAHAFRLGSPEVPKFNREKEYRKEILKAAGLKGRHELRLVVDHMHGAGQELYGKVLSEMFVINTQIRNTPDPLFGNQKPEPLEERLDELKQRVLYDGNDSIGLAFDGDGDRLAVIDETGRFLATHEIYCLLLEHMVKRHAAEGVAISTVSFSGLVEKVARSHGITLSEVPVGFKHVSKAMEEYEAFMGGEESGGTGFGHHLPERDALLMALMLLNERVQSGQRLAELVDDLYARFGRPHYIRHDVRLDAAEELLSLKMRLREWGEDTQLAGDEVIGLNHRDGMKKKTAHGWVLVRPSGTEPLLRFYVEGDTAEYAERYLASAQEALGLG